ncbi:uncharacterized protein THITE_2112245 [Thermothielavioides terrestris NRRL 8126]|uniref:Diphthine--ammonia ligase n=2 Tax=Thermothielavioides terrestris TaxID=2587410 RepID=G2QY52_THETT|nr:uncharacterized protein THITE_2112245 [Thermothielavioides terrestris NRRL 8126]AEO65346.1 hypothetical protein THITE_2112245 [Thermothielavioides terrestris NRRL 8126]
MATEAGEDEHDLNSFMYQTVGHQVVPLYAEATGIPLYRRAIAGGATQPGKEYSHYRRSGEPPERRSPSGFTSRSGGDARHALGQHDDLQEPGDVAGSPQHAGPEEHRHPADDGTAPEEPDETESMVPLLQAIQKAHPEANALCAGAILSTYQRTRVESVATRLGLTPLAYLWKFPVLPGPGQSTGSPGSDAQLLDDMAAAGMEARIIKVASGGLDDSFLWTNVASAAGKERLARAMRRFGTAETGAVIGEGGEFETLVLDGPPSLFQKRIVVAEEDRRVISEGGGSAWLRLQNARLENKGATNTTDGMECRVRVPDLLDPKFNGVLGALSCPDAGEPLPDPQSRPLDVEDGNSVKLGSLQSGVNRKLQTWCFVVGRSASIEAETQTIVELIRERLRQHCLPSSAILSATVVLRRMADFPAINNIYGTLFTEPNPASRVTISCGESLSAAAAAAADTGIAVYLNVHTALPPGQRHGLHVQSRSYWAPANIGPYSQAISVPVASLGSAGSDASSASGPRLVSVAGQIPLVPATMALPPGAPEDTLPLQLALSLQHLWRIGAEMGVQWWTSAVAYFPKCAAGDDGGRMVRKARLASQAWRTAHQSKPSPSPGDEEDEDEGGPDLWDRRYNAQYMAFATGEEENKGAPPLPDRAVLASSPAVLSPTATAAVPPLFVAEVDELPRGAGVEWHAHLGVAHARERSVVLREARLPAPGGEEEGREVAVWQVIVPAATAEERRTSFVQTVVAEPYSGSARPGSSHARVARAALSQLGDVGLAGELAAAVRYMDAELLKAGAEKVGMEELGPVVLCRSLWDAKGTRLAAVTVYHSVFC